MVLLHSMLSQATSSLISSFTVFFFNNTIAPHLENSSVWAEPWSQAFIFCKTLTKCLPLNSVHQKVHHYQDPLRKMILDIRVKMEAVFQMLRQPSYFPFVTSHVDTRSISTQQEPLRGLSQFVYKGDWLVLPSYLLWQQKIGPLL